MSRQKKDEDIVDYFTAIFSQCDDPQRMWIGEIIETGEEKYNDWKKKIQSLNYLFQTRDDADFVVTKTLTLCLSVRMVNTRLLSKNT